MNKAILAALPLLLLAACDNGQGKVTASSRTSVDGVVTGIRIDDPWCRPTPNGARVGACYLTLTADGGDDRLVSVSSALAGSVQIHEMKMADGMMSMAELPDGLPLPAGQAVALKPGSTHLMLIDLKEPLTDGGVASLTLTFDKAAPLGVHAPVRQPLVK